MSCLSFDQIPKAKVLMASEIGQCFTCYLLQSLLHCLPPLAPSQGCLASLEHTKTIPAPGPLLEEWGPETPQPPLSCTFHILLPCFAPSLAHMPLHLTILTWQTLFFTLPLLLLWDRVLYITQASPELTAIILPLPPWFWDYRHVPLCPAYDHLFRTGHPSFGIMFLLFLNWARPWGQLQVRGCARMSTRTWSWLKMARTGLGVQLCGRTRT